MPKLKNSNGTFWVIFKQRALCRIICLSIPWISKKWNLWSRSNISCDKAILSHCSKKGVSRESILLEKIFGPLYCCCDFWWHKKRSHFCPFTLKKERGENETSNTICNICQKPFPMAPHFQRWCRLCTGLQSYNDDNICENDRAKQSCKSLNCLLVTIPRDARVREDNFDNIKRVKWKTKIPILHIV